MDETTKSRGAKTEKLVQDSSRRWEFGTLKSAVDGIDLRYATYGSLQDKPDAYENFLVFLNGRTEWIEKYDYLPAALKLQSKCGFLTFDHRGQGASGGTRSYVSDYGDFYSDAKQIIQHVVGKRPFAMMSHSMGGLISLTGILSATLQPEILVASSPLLGLFPGTPMKAGFMKKLSFGLSTLGFAKVGTGAGSYTNAKFETNELTHCKTFFERCLNTPYVAPSATIGWANSTFRAIDFIFDSKNLKNLKAPIRLICSRDDEVVNAAAVEKFAEFLKEHKKDVQWQFLKGAKHELFGEIPKYYDETIAKVREWLVPLKKYV